MKNPKKLLVRINWVFSKKLVLYVAGLGLVSLVLPHSKPEGVSRYEVNEILPGVKATVKTTVRSTPQLEFSRNLECCRQS